MKQIEIDGTKYDIEANALTYFDYERIFKRGVFQDLDILQKFVTTQVVLADKYKKENPDLTDAQLEILLSRDMRQNLDEYVLASTRLAYILIYEANNNIPEYKEWLKSIKNLRTNDSLIVEVTEFAVDHFCWRASSWRAK